MANDVLITKLVVVAAKRGVFMTRSSTKWKEGYEEDDYDLKRQV